MSKIEYDYDIYLAGPFFNDEQKARMDNVKNLLVELGYVVADPREFGPVIVDSAPEAKTPAFFKGIFDGNIQAMDKSFMVLASLDDKDIGTAFELGHMYASLKFVTSFAFGGGKTNVMLGQAVDQHFTSPEELREFFLKYRRVLFQRDDMVILDLFEKSKKAEADE